MAVLKSSEEGRHHSNVVPGTKKPEKYHDDVLGHIKGSKLINDMKSELSESCESMYMYDGGDKLTKTPPKKSKSSKSGKVKNEES